MSLTLPAPPAPHYGLACAFYDFYHDMLAPPWRGNPWQDADKENRTAPGPAFENGSEEDKRKRFDAALKSLNETAQRVQSLWAWFLGISLFFAVTVGATTHRMLFLQEGLTLPFVSVKLPLEGFFIIGPLTYLLAHLYMLTMLVALARTALPFEQALKALTWRNGQRDEAEEERLRALVTDSLFVVSLSGPKRRPAVDENGQVRWHSVAFRAWLYWLIAIVTVAIGPVLLLLFFQLMFLPYQHETITWFHRAVVMLDAAILFVLWPSYRRLWGARLGPLWRPLGLLALQWAGLAILAFVTLAASFPCAIAPYGPGQPEGRARLLTCKNGWDGLTRQMARWMEGTFFGYRAYECVEGGSGKAEKRKDYCVVPAAWRVSIPHLKDLTVQKEGDARAKPKDHVIWSEPYGPYTVFGRFPNRMELANQTLVDRALTDKLLAAHRERRAAENSAIRAKFIDRPMPGDEKKPEVSSASERHAVTLTGRNFRAADFARADLTLADFGAAVDDCSRYSPPDAASDDSIAPMPAGAPDMTAVNFSNAWLRDARFSCASGEYAVFDNAKLSLTETDRPLLEKARLRAASLQEAQLQGASLREAELQGASLWGAQLRNASLQFAQLGGASLDYAQLQGAPLSMAQLQGASLTAAQLQGASLDGAKLQSADLEGANFEFAVFKGAQLDRVSLNGNKFYGALISGGSAWKARGSVDLSTAVLVAAPAPHLLDLGHHPVTGTPLTAAEWVGQMLSGIPDGHRKDTARQGLLVLLDQADPEGDKPEWKPVVDPKDPAG